MYIVKWPNISHSCATDHQASESVGHNQYHDSATGYAASESVAVLSGFVSQWWHPI